MSQIIYKGKKRKTNDAYGYSVSVKWSHCLSLKEFEKWGIKMLNGDGVISVQRRLMG
jgi:hypothetical protein